MMNRKQRHDPPPANPPPLAQGPALRQQHLIIGGMRCATCAQLIEFHLRQLPGVASFNIDSVQQSARLEFDPTQTALRDLIDAVTRLGYRALPQERAGDVAALDAQLAKTALWRLFVAGFAMMQVMMMAFPAYLQPVPQIDGDLTPDIDQLLKLASLLLSIPVMLFSARPFFAGAWRDWQNRHVGMDLPIAIGIATTFCASLWGTFAHGPVYYDSVVMFVFLLLGARWLEARVQARSSQALRALTDLAPAMAERFRNDVGSAEIDSVPVGELQAGDVLRVRPGSQFAVDGVVLAGAGSVDEALMTGEAQAVLKNVGDNVLAGALNLTGVLAVRATRVGSQTRFAGLLQMMQQAAQHKPRLVQLADRYASRFLALVLLLSAASGLLWWQIDASRALMIAVSVMVVTCPCALSLATPGVMAAALGQMAQHGVLLVRGSALEAMVRASHFVFDKTGTLTSGQLQVVQQHWLRDELASAPVLASLAASSLHPVARALAPATSLAAGNRLDEVRLAEVYEVAGKGVQGQSQGRTFRLGQFDFVRAGARSGIALPPVAAHASVVYFGDQEGLLAWFVLQDQLRPDAKALIDNLLAQGKQVCLLSGDRPQVVAGIAAGLGIADARGGLSPLQKYEIVQQMQRQGAVVAMIGDGMNDGPVLSLADVSIAMGHGAPISQARSDVVLISNRLADLQYALQVARFGLKLIRQNLLWAVLYNLLAIPAAMAGILAPWQAALGMSISSLWVVCNALRLLRLRQKPV
jgi:Cu2+-exporting ATPase